MLLSRLYLSATILGLLFAGVFGSAAAQQATPVPLRPCPLLLTRHDPAYCTVGLSAAAVSNALRPDTADTGKPVLLALDEPMLGITGDMPLLAPQSSLQTGVPDAGRLGFTIHTGGPARHSGPPRDTPRSGGVEAEYDLAVFDSFALTSSSALRQGPDMESLNSRTNSANSNLGLTYEDYGISVVIRPNVSVNWGDAVAGQTYLGVTNEISTEVTRDVTLSLTSGYDSTSFPGDPLQNYNATRTRLAVSWEYADGYVLGLSGHSRDERNHWESRNLIGPGLALTLPLSETIELTANSEFSFVQRDLQHAAETSPSAYQQTLGLQASWMPALFASHAMSIIAGYTLNYDSASVGVPSYTSLARLALAMSF